jgi:hypothetical protein
MCITTALTERKINGPGNRPDWKGSVGVWVCGSVGVGKELEVFRLIAPAGDYARRGMRSQHKSELLKFDSNFLKTFCFIEGTSLGNGSVPCGKNMAVSPW